MKEFLRKIGEQTGIRLDERSFKFWIGIVLLVTNQPLGWGGMLIFNSLALRYHSAIYSYIGFGIYALSWGMLGLGFLLAGPEGYQLVKAVFQYIKNKYFGKKKKNED
jgi:hypothetical protein